MTDEIYNLNDEDIKIRAAAIISAGKTGGGKAVRSLIGILENESEIDWLRACAAIALGRISDEAVVPHLLNALWDHSSVVSRAAISALGDTGSRQAVSPFIKVLEDPDKQELHPLIVKVLGEIGGREIAPILLRALESPHNPVRIQAAMVLGEMVAAEAVPSLIELMNDSDECLRAIAASSLGLIGDKQAVKTLLEALNDNAGTVRTVAASSLGCLGDCTAIEPLEKALSDECPTVRRQAEAALIKIRQQVSSMPGKRV